MINSEIILACYNIFCLCILITKKVENINYYCYQIIIRLSEHIK